MRSQSIVFVIIVLGGSILAGGGWLLTSDPSPPTGTLDGAAADDAPATSDPDEDKEPADRPYEPPNPPGAVERRADRERMVAQQIARRRYGAIDVTSDAVLAAMRAVPRHAFVPSNMRSRAYRDTPLPIGHGQTISQPYIVALMTQLLDLSAEDKVLEIGTGSGYQAAVLAHLTPHVYTIEIVEPLATRAQQALLDQKYDMIHCRRADGYHGWEEQAPFDAIIVTCAAGHLPPPLWDQLKPGGCIVIPIGGPYEVQRLVRIVKEEDGSRRSEAIMSVRFVPLTRQPDGDE
jgi:protein-L-isoaspartate(D-aspartate) O-methyltransferase